MIVSKSVLSSRLENDAMSHWRVRGVYLNPEMVQRSVIGQVEKNLRLIGLQLRKLTTTKKIRFDTRSFKFIKTPQIFI